MIKTIKQQELMKADIDQLKTRSVDSSMARKVFEIINRANEGDTFCVKAIEISGLKTQNDYETNRGVVHDAVVEYLVESGVFVDEFIDARGEISAAISRDQEKAKDLKYYILEKSN